MTDSPGRPLVVTYCCRDKDPSGEPLSAVERYLSPRIRITALAAASANLDFLILSGRYGLIPPLTMIPDYDHLLTRDEIPAQAARAAAQLGSRRPDRVVFVSRPLEEDPGCGPYRDVMAEVCRQTGAAFVVREIGPGDPGPDMLDDLA